MKITKQISVLLLFFITPVILMSQAETAKLLENMNKVYKIEIVKGKPIIDMKKKIFIDGFGDVKINGKKQFKYKRFDMYDGKDKTDNEFIGSAIGIYKKNEDNIIFTSQDYMLKMDNGSEAYIIEFIFPSQNKQFLSRKVGSLSWLSAVRLIIFEKVINLNGEIDPDALKKFIKNYNDIKQGSHIYDLIKS